MDQQLYERILYECRKRCRLCAHAQMPATEDPCKTCIKKCADKFGEPWRAVSGSGFEPANPAYFETLCNIYEMHYKRLAAAAREFSKVETAIKKTARESNVDMRDVKYIFKRIK